MHSHLQRTRDAIDQATDGMTLDQMSWHPDGKWCTAEVLEHLALAFGGSAKLLARAADDGKSAATTSTFKQRFRTWVVTEREFLPGGRTAPKMVTPRGMPADQVLAAIRKSLADMDEAISACESKLGTKIKIADHPILGPLTVTQWRKFHMVHTCHHMKQIATLRAQMKNGQSNP
jgi:hypothetical protein